MLEASASHNPLENERRTRIRRRLRLVGPGPAGAYEDALQLMFAEQCAKPLNALPQLIGHLFRETESALRSVLDPQTTREGKSKDAHKASIERVLTHLDVPTNSPLRSAWVRFAQDDDRRLSAWVHRNNLLGPKFPHAELEALFEDFEQVLDGVLEHFEAHYFRYRSKVDALIRKENPTKADVEFLQQHAPHDDVTFRRFFQGVSNPQWLPLLQEGGYFRGIPSAVRDGDNVSFPVWLPVLALQRLGKVSPEEVAGILFSLEETDNDWVTGYLMDVALSFPPKLAAKWAKREARRMRTVATAYLWLPSSCQKMIEYLAKEREFAAALELATAMLGLNAEPDKRPSIDYAFEVKREGERKMTVMKIGQYEYEEIAKAVVEQLTSYFGIRVVELFAGQLEFAIQHDGYEKEPPEDHSYSWRPAIGDSERNYRGNVHQSLVTPLRDAALRLAQDESTRSTVIQYLLAQKWQVFWRLAMYITVLRCKPSDPAVAQLLKAKQWGDQWYALPEYFLLLRHAFKAMSDGQKAKCLDWVEHLPNLSAGIASFKEGQGDDPSEEDIEDYRAYRGVRVLWKIRDVLPTTWDKQYAEWQKRQAGREAELMERVSKNVHRVDGPKTREELAEMEVEAVLEFLRTWEPDTSLHSTTNNARAFAIELADDVKRRPMEYFALRHKFVATEDPTWCSALLNGLRGYDWRDEDWDKLIPFLMTLTDWGPNKGSPKADKYPHSDFSRSMTWSRVCILELLKRGLEVREDQPGLPYEYADAVWSILKKLLDDPDPDADRHSTRNGTQDYALTAINCVRSEALQTVIHYGVWWVFQNYRTSEERLEREKHHSVMREIPGLLDVLDHHLRDDEHPAVWAVYGFSMAMLIYLGRDWVEENLPRLFPDDDSPPTRHEAVWTTFIRYYQANTIANKVLRGQFVKETAKLTDKAVDKDDHRTARAWDRLAIHLMIMFWWGEVDLDEEPVSTFFRQASDELRAHAIDYLGNQYSRFLRGGDGENDPTDRLMKLWDERNKRAAAAEGQGFGQEMGAFLSFFAAGGSIPTHVVLDPEQDQGEYTLGVKPAFRGDGEWVLDRLIKSLKWTKGSTWMHDTELARKFSNFADDELQGKAIKALRMLVESNRQDFGLSFWIRDAEALIKSAAKAEGRESREECYRLINILGSVGIDDYRALLPVERGGVPAEQSDQVKAEAATKLPAKDRKPKSKTKQRQSSAPKGRSKQHGRAKGPSTKRRKKGR